MPWRRCWWARGGQIEDICRCSIPAGMAHGPVLNTALWGHRCGVWVIKGKEAGMPITPVGRACRAAVPAYAHAGGGATLRRWRIGARLYGGGL